MIVQTKEQVADDLKRAYQNACAGMNKRKPDLILVAADVFAIITELAYDATTIGAKVIDDEGRMRIGNAYVVKSESLPDGRVVFCKVLHQEN